MRRTTTSALRLVAALVVAAAALGACSGGDDDGGDDGGGDGGQAEVTTTTVERAPLDPSNPCLLVTGPEIALAFQMGFADGVLEDTFGLASSAPTGADTKVCSWSTRNGGPLAGVALVVQAPADAEAAYETQKAAFAQETTGLPLRELDGYGDAAFEAGHLLVVLDGNVVFGVSTVAEGADPAAEARHAAGREALARAVLDR